jgi:hypothetical protein
MTNACNNVIGKVEVESLLGKASLKWEVILKLILKM